MYVNAWVAFGLFFLFTARHTIRTDTFASVMSEHSAYTPAGHPVVPGICIVHDLLFSGLFSSSLKPFRDTLYISSS